MKYKIRRKLLEIIKKLTMPLVLIVEFLILEIIGIAVHVFPKLSAIICLFITAGVIGCILLWLFVWAVEKLDELLDNLIEKLAKDWRT